MPTAGQDYPGSYGELLAWFPDELACIDYGVVALAGRVSLPAVRESRRLAIADRSLGVHGVWASDLGHGGNDLPPDAHAATDVVRGGVADDRAEPGGLGARTIAGETGAASAHAVW